MSRHSPGKLPYPFDRIQIRTVSRKKFELEPRLSSHPPFLVKRRMMVSHVISDHDNLSVRSKTNGPKLPQERKASLGVETIGLAPIEQLAVAQPHCTEISDTPSRRMMQQYWVGRIRRNPHPASRTVLLEVNFIHCPKINSFASCQPAEFFLPGTGPRRLHWRLRVSAFEGEIQAGEKAAGIAASPGSRSTSASRTRIRSSHPIGFLSARSSSAAFAGPRRCFRSAPRSVAWDGQAALRPLGRSVHSIQNVEPNRLRFAAHPPRDLRLGDSSCLGRRATIRGAGGHTEIPRNVESHPVARVLLFPHPLWLVASCHQYSTCLSRAQLLMTLCIGM